MASQPQAAPFNADKTQPADIRMAEALEFIAQRLAGIERDLGIIRADVKARVMRQTP